MVDLTPLAGLSKLKRLDLHGTRVADLTPLAGLTKLEGIWLNDRVPPAQVAALKTKSPSLVVYGPLDAPDWR